ncbi:MAG: hypothetical protein AAF772_03115 [Acidobacteriota bacterium]
MSRRAETHRTDLAFAEPILAATAYDQGQHDRLIDEVIAPFWTNCTARTEDSFFWTMRFGARGEHMKLRFHGPEALADAVRTDLAPALDAFVASLPAEHPQPPGSFPAIDPEDARPDPGVGWHFTTFRASPYILGGEPLAEDSTFAALFAKTQGAMAEWVMSDLAPRYQDGRFSSIRQTCGVQAILAAFSVLPFERTEVIAYLTYHRDWLTRFVAARNHQSEAQISDILTPLDFKVQRAKKTVAALAQRLDAGVVPPSFEAWTERISAVYQHSLVYRDDPRFNLDPYTQNHSFLPLFKTLQGSTNQIGFAISAELWAYHLLLAAAEWQAGANEAEVA